MEQAPKPFEQGRPWGGELWFKEKPSMVKILSVNPGQALSLQYHHHRDEYWYVLSGEGSAIVGTEQLPLTQGASVFVSRETKHRLMGGTGSPLVILELAFGNFDQNDIVRLEDNYGRK